MATDEPIFLPAPARPNHDDRPPEIIPIHPSQTSHPYPERWTRETGVRHHTELGPLPSWESQRPPELDHPLPFGASLPPQLPQTRSHYIPWESLSLYAFGQIILTATIGFTGAGLALSLALTGLWIICGLCLMLAQVLGSGWRR